MKGVYKMENNARSSFKEKLFAMFLCLVLILPLAPVGSQETDEVLSDDTWPDISSADTGADVTVTLAPDEAVSEEPPKTTASGEAPRAVTPNASPKTSVPKASPGIFEIKTVTRLVNRVIGYISKIGAIFGQTTGIRIGGTSASAIAMLVIARLIRDRAPDWVKWLLYASGGTMIAGSGANITQMIMRFL